MNLLFHDQSLLQNISVILKTLKSKSSVNLNHLNVVLLGGGSEHASAISEWDAVQSWSLCSHVTAAKIPIFRSKGSNVFV